MKKALFLDRDGVVNKEKHYIYKKEQFEFIENIFNVCEIFQDKGYLLIIITNQSGIARQYYNEDQFHELNDWMLHEFKKRNIEITKVYYCPHHPDKGFGSYKVDCNCRKPKPGMIFEACKEFNIDLSNSLLIGDKPRDIEAGINAGIGQNFLFDSCKNESSNQIINNESVNVINALNEIFEFIK